MIGPKSASDDHHPPHRTLTNTFVTDYQAFSQCSDVRMRYVGVVSPTSTMIQIGGLAQPEAMVEIEMIAVVE